MKAFSPEEFVLSKIIESGYFDRKANKSVFHKVQNEMVKEISKGMQAIDCALLLSRYKYFYVSEFWNLSKANDDNPELYNWLMKVQKHLDIYHEMYKLEMKHKRGY